MKRNYITIILLLCISFSTYAQSISNQRDGFYFYWGWNRASYTTSDFEFKGENYHFNLEDVRAKDRQSELKFKTYALKPTIPQYNFRVGYYFKKKYDLSFGIDHMKYVVQNDQTVRMSGVIENSGTIYDGVYDNEEVFLSPRLVRLEHTDGLNYIHFSLRRTDNILVLKHFKLSLIEGFSLGGMFPKTDSQILGKERSDDFHLSGVGTDIMLGLQIGIGNNFFILSEWKGGYANLPDVKTTLDEADRAKQDFFFSQFNIVFGANIFGGYKLKSEKSQN